MAGRPQERVVGLRRRHGVLVPEGRALEVDVRGIDPDVVEPEVRQRLVGQLRRVRLRQQDPLGHGERDDVRDGLSPGGERGPPGQQTRVRTAAGGRMDDRPRVAAGVRALRHELRERRRETSRSDRRAAADGNGEGSPALRTQLRGQPVLRLFELTPVIRAGMVRPRAEERREELVAGRSLRRRAAEHQVDVQAEPGARGRGHPAVVGLAGSDGDERVSALGHRRTAQVLELAGLVAAHPQPRQVVALDPQAGTPGQQRPPLQRRGQRGQLGARLRGDRRRQSLGAHVV